MLTSRSQRLWVLAEAIAWIVAIVFLLVWLVRYLDGGMGTRETVREVAVQPMDARQWLPAPSTSAARSSTTTN
jgi:hypothetical protein